MRLFGEMLSRRELLERVGDIRQVGGIIRTQRLEGVERGVEVVEVRTGAGFSFEVLPSRGLDLGAAKLFDRSLAWHSAARFSHPGLIDHRTPEHYHHGFGGGLLNTCGLRNVGQPNEDEGTIHDMHGRSSSTPAFEVCASGEWTGDEYVMTVRGTTREAALNADKLEKTRTIVARLGDARLEITDVVENIGSRPAALALLYHFNIGWPLLSSGASIEMNSLAQRPVLGSAADWSEVPAPDASYAASVIEHEIHPDENGWRRAAVAGGGLRLHVAWQAAKLPRFTQWRQYGSGDYVLGLEPGTVGVLGRAWERANGTLPFLAPGETRTFRLTVSVEAA